MAVHIHLPLVSSKGRRSTYAHILVFSFSGNIALGAGVLDVSAYNTIGPFCEAELKGCLHMSGHASQIVQQVGLQYATDEFLACWMSGNGGFCGRCVSIIGVGEMEDGVGVMGDGWSPCRRLRCIETLSLLPGRALLGRQSFSATKYESSLDFRFISSFGFGFCETFQIL